MSGWQGAAQDREQVPYWCRKAAEQDDTQAAKAVAAELEAHEKPH
jgi:hypothetical protein